MRQVGPNSRKTTLLKLDGRRREAKRLAAITDDLTRFAAHPSNVITVGQTILVKRLALDLLRLELMDASMAMGACSEREGIIAHALRNSVRLGLRDLRRPELRAQPPKPKPKTDDLDDLGALLRHLDGGIIA